jgi:nitroimidazol reductase NimA-like FMN-containing flavoprotein (pyridoxamine 5'-phosphate oxidase superfamily)
MRMIDSRTGLEWLDREECLVLLAGDEIGRLAVVVGDAPVIIPVNYRLDGDTILLRSDDGTKISYGTRGHVAFEIDHLDRARRTGWSVVVTGRLEECDLGEPGALDRAHRSAVYPWVGGAKPHLLRIVPEQITGRRVGRTGWS